MLMYVRLVPVMVLTVRETTHTAPHTQTAITETEITPPIITETEIARTEGVRVSTKERP